MKSDSQTTLPTTIESGLDTPMEAHEVNSIAVVALPDGPCIDTLSIEPKSPSSKLDVMTLPPPPEVVPGVVGLQNIGNTCFMNSVCQSLLHCRPLCDYFISGAFKAEINDQNPLGSGGKLASEFGTLVDRVWVSPSERVITPRDLKWVIGQHAPMFMGYHQHDSQEFVTFLLDGLHEDLNLVKQKPYTETIEADDRPDALVAKLCWEQHLLRNRSKIVDIFQGQYKSRLRCPHCSKSSVTFDPFMYLSLPIPSQPDLPLLVTFTYAQLEPPQPPVRLAVNVYRDATDLPQAIAAAVAAELPSEYSESIISDDIMVYIQSTTFNCFQAMESNDAFSNASLVSKRRVFCTVAPRAVHNDQQPADDNIEQPFAKRHRYNTLTMSIQVRMCPKTSWTSTNPSPLDSTRSPQITPSLEFVAVGPPTAICVSNTMSGNELMSEIKRAVFHSVGSRSRHLLEGMKSSAALVRIIENGATIGTVGFGAEIPDDFLSGENNRLSGSLITLFVDIPVNDSRGEDEDSSSWKDLSADILARVGDYYRTEKSWRLASVLAPQSVNQRVSINDCFRLFSSEEVLGESDQWYCSNCKEHVRASKKLDLWMMPDVLIVHLKRFQYSRGFRNKIESVIEFPSGDEVLDVEQFLPEQAVAEITKSLKYKLFGVSNHMGSLYSGHYTAHAKMWADPNSPTNRRKDDTWFSFNDSYVSEMSLPPSPDSSAYLLFYERVSL